MNNKIALYLTAFFTSAIVSPITSIHAQDESTPQRGPRHDRPGPAYMTALDANKDGTLDKAEIAASVDALKKLDTNSDGKLTVAELRGAPGRGPRESDERDERPQRPQGTERPGRQQTEAAAGRRPALPPLLASADANKSGALESDELSAVPASLSKLDKNSDGQLTRDEMRVGRAPRAGAERPRDGERPRREERAPKSDSN